MLIIVLSKIHVVFCSFTACTTSTPHRFLTRESSLSEWVFVCVITSTNTKDICKYAPTVRTRVNSKIIKCFELLATWNKSLWDVYWKKRLNTKSFSSIGSQFHVQGAATILAVTTVCTVLFCTIVAVFRVCLVMLYCVAVRCNREKT